MPNANEHFRKVTADAVETGAILLVDESGTQRAVLTCSTNEQSNEGHVLVHLYDGKGRVRMTLQVDDKEGPSVSLFNGTCSPCVSLGVAEGRGNGLTVCDSQGRPRIHVGVNDVETSDNQYAEFNIRDSQGRVFWSQSESLLD